MNQEECVICGSEATSTCYHCGSAYCEQHYEKVVGTGNCCGEN